MIDFMALKNTVFACLTYLDEVNKWYDDQVKYIKENFAGPTLKQKMSEVTMERDNRISAKKAECFAYLKSEETRLRGELKDNLTQSLTPDQIGVLQALKMRKTVDEKEIDAYAERYSGQFMFLSILKDFAIERGVFLYVPTFTDTSAAIDKIFKMLSDSVTYFKDMPSLSLETRDILAYPEHSKSFKEQCDILNSGFFPPKAESNPRKITTSEQKMLDKIFEGILGEELSEAVRNAAKSPEMKDLLMLSSYNSFIQE